MAKAVENKITIYHGSEKILKEPEFGKGEINNDYGQGFYCTKNKGLAGEWAVLWTGQDGYINEYSFDYTGLNVLYLNQMPVENWISVLITAANHHFKWWYERSAPRGRKVNASLILNFILLISMI